MGNADGMSRRGNKSDYYITPWQCVQVLVDYLDVVESKGISILDPACGTGVIGKVLRRNGFNNVIESDLIQGEDFLDRDESKEHFSYIITNPPYSIKNRFIDKALKLANVVIYILPANVINYNEFQEMYLDRPEYAGRLLMRPKFFMEAEEKNSPKLGGVSSYAWFVWSKNSNTIGSWEHYVDLRQYFRKE